MLCRVPERLTPLDASFLHTETATAHMHVAWKGRFRPGPGRPPITLARVRAQVASRLGGAPRFRMRLAYPAGGFAGPVWVDAEGFDLRRHVVALGGDDEVLARSQFDARADAALSQPLDRSHPLWEIHLAPRLEDGSVGLVMKIHHAMVDGKSALAVALLLLDLDPDAPEPAPPSGAWTRGPGAGAGSAGGRSAGRVGSGAAARAGASGARGGLPSSAGRDAAAGGAVGRGGRGAVGAVVVPQPRDRAAADAGRAHRGRRAAARRQAGVGRLVERRRAGRGGRRAATACPAATRGAGAGQGDGSRVAAGRGRDGGHGQPHRVRVHHAAGAPARPARAAAGHLRRDRGVQGERAGERRRGADERAGAAAAAAAGAGGSLRGVAADVQPRGLERAGAADAGLPARRGVRRGAPCHPAVGGPRAVGRRLHACATACASARTRTRRRCRRSASSRPPSAWRRSSSARSRRSRASPSGSRGRRRARR